MARPPTPSQELARPSVETRCQVRDALAAAEEIAPLDAPTRTELAHALVRITEAAKLLEKEACAGPGPAEPSPIQPAREPEEAPAPPAAAMNAGEEFSGTAVDRMAGATRNVLEAISFPRFVGELVNGVFKAMLDTNQQQLQQYLELIRGVSQSLEGFSSLGGNDDAARRWLVERFPASFAIEGEEAEDDDFPAMDDDDGPEPLRLISVGSPPSEEALRAALSLEADAEVPSGGGEALVPFVKRALAGNRQGMLATMIQMGMQRIVIDSGKITAGMRFHIDASSAAEDRQSSAFDARTDIAASGSASMGWWSASASMSSTIGMVRTSDTRTSEDLNASADLNSSVELNFRTDQVPLDRLASRMTQQRLTQNSLNPDRETELMLQAEQARQQRYQARDTERQGRQAPALAPRDNMPQAPQAPNLVESIIRDRAGQGREGQQGQQDDRSRQSAPAADAPARQQPGQPAAGADATPPGQSPTAQNPATRSPPVQGSPAPNAPANPPAATAPAG